MGPFDLRGSTECEARIMPSPTFEAKPALGGFQCRFLAETASALDGRQEPRTLHLRFAPLNVATPGQRDHQDRPASPQLRSEILPGTTPKDPNEDDCSESRDTRLSVTSFPKPAFCCGGRWRYVPRPFERSRARHGFLGRHRASNAHERRGPNRDRLVSVLAVKATNDETPTHRACRLCRDGDAM